MACITSSDDIQPPEHYAVRQHFNVWCPTLVKGPKLTVIIRPLLNNTAPGHIVNVWLLVNFVAW